MQNRNQILTIALAVAAIPTFVLAQQRPISSLPNPLDGEPSIQRPATPTAGAVPAVTFTFGAVSYPAVDARQAVRGINDRGRMIGHYVDASLNTTGYLLQGTAFKAIAYPGSGVRTVPIGMNKAGAVVGLYTADQGSTYHGFILNHSTYTSMDYPGANYTAFTGINTSGVVVGRYYNTPLNYHGFILSAGVFTPVDFPSATTTSILAINASAEVAGTYSAQDGSIHGFTLQGGTYTSVDYPGAADTNVNGINDSGQIVGSYSNDGVTYHGFLLKDGVATSFDVPFISSLLYTFPYGINNHNQIVGSYYDSNGHALGFVATFQ